MFPVNTIIAWDANIYHKHKDIIITTLLLPLGHISNNKLDQNKHLRTGTWYASMMTHKYRGSQQSSREVKPKFIDSTQGETKNTYKP